MAVAEICNREAIVARRDTSILEAARLMREHHVGDLVVVEESAGRRLPVGMLTDRDIAVQVVARELAPTATQVGEIMTPEPVTARATEGLLEAVRRMSGHAVRRMPVVDAEGSLVGVLSIDDLLDLLAMELGELSRVTTRQQGQERLRRR